MWLRQSTSAVLSFGFFVDPTDGITLKTGLVAALDNAATGIKLSKAGGALTVRHAAVTASTYDSYGNYLVTLDTTDTNTLGRLVVQFAGNATCNPWRQDYMVLPAVVYDSLVPGTDFLQVDLTQINGASTNVAALDALAASVTVGTVNTGGFSSTATEFETSSPNPAGASYYVGTEVKAISGALAGQWGGSVIAYSKSGSNGHFTVNTGWPVTGSFLANADKVIFV